MARTRKKPLIIPQGEFEEAIFEETKLQGGIANWHAHYDRGLTLNPRYTRGHARTPIEMAHATLAEKQEGTGILHNGLAYSAENDYKDLKGRVRKQLDGEIETGVKWIVSFADVTPDLCIDEKNLKSGLGPILAMAEVKKEYERDINLQLATQPIFGLLKPDRRLDDVVTRRVLYEIACKEVADVCGGLAERDGRSECQPYGGEDEHNKIIINIARKLKKPAHFHVDQSNDPSSAQTIRLAQMVYFTRKQMNIPDIDVNGDPLFWAIHVLSPSAYSEKRFRELLDWLKRANVGVICCPRAAMSMFQNPAIKAPTHNSVARIFEMLYWGIPVRIGTDNNSDMFIPTSSTVLEEMKRLADDLRFYDIRILSKICSVSPRPIDASDKKIIGEYLVEKRDRAAKRAKGEGRNFEFCIPLD